MTIRHIVFVVASELLLAISHRAQIRMSTNQPSSKLRTIHSPSIMIRSAEVFQSNQKNSVLNSHEILLISESITNFQLKKRPFDAITITHIDHSDRYNSIK